MVPTSRSHFLLLQKQYPARGILSSGSSEKGTGRGSRSCEDWTEIRQELGSSHSSLESPERVSMAEGILEASGKGDAIELKLIITALSQFHSLGAPNESRPMLTYSISSWTTRI